MKLVAFWRAPKSKLSGAILAPALQLPGRRITGTAECLRSYGEASPSVGRRNALGRARMSGPSGPGPTRYQSPQLVFPEGERRSPHHRPTGISPTPIQPSALRLGLPAQESRKPPLHGASDATAGPRHTRGQ